MSENLEKEFEETEEELEKLNCGYNKQGKFKIQGSRYFLTYKTHINKEEYTNWFIDTKLGGKVEKLKFIRLAHENGKNSDKVDNYEHTHVLVDLNEGYQSVNCHIFDYKISSKKGGIHCNIKVCGIKKIDWVRLMRYMAKEDKENADLLTEAAKICIEKVPWAERVWACKTLQEAMLLCEKPSDAMGIKTLFECRIRPSPIKEWQIPKQEWQIQLMNETNQETNQFNERKIKWIVDTVGNTGKTELARYMYSMEREKWLCTKDLGTSRDAATIVKGAIQSGWNGHGVIVDLPRSASDDDKRLYTYLETLKDGFVTATKYTGGTEIFEKGHMIVFANWPPKVPLLSVDRWDIRRLIRDEKGTVHMVECAIEGKRLLEDFENEEFYEFN